MDSLTPVKIKMLQILEISFYTLKFKKIKIITHLKEVCCKFQHTIGNHKFFLLVGLLLNLKI